MCQASETRKREESYERASDARENATRLVLVPGGTPEESALLSLSPGVTAGGAGRGGHVAVLRVRFRPSFVTVTFASTPKLVAWCLALALRARSNHAKRRKTHPSSLLEGPEREILG